MVSAAQAAERTHVPVPPVMVTGTVTLAAIPAGVPSEQTLPAAAVMVGIMVEVVVAVTVNVVPKAALAGAPVKVTVGVANDAVVV